MAGWYVRHARKGPTMPVVTFGGRVGGAADLPEPTQLDLPDNGTEPDPHFVVGVVDTGVVVGSDGEPHPFLARHLAAGWRENVDVVPTDGTLGPHDGHGTFIAGLIHHGAPAATLDVRNALDEPPNGEADFLAGDLRNNDGRVAEQIGALAAVPDLKLVNLSFFGEGGPERTPPPEIRAALEHLFHCHPDVLIVTAAGNRWTPWPTFPARFKEEFPQVIAVGAVDDTVTPVPGLSVPRASFSNYWRGIDVYAPGVRVLGPYLSGTYGTRATAVSFTGWCRWSGTSFAAATVTGLLAAAMIDQGILGPLARERVFAQIPLPTLGTGDAG